MKRFGSEINPPNPFETVRYESEPGTSESNDEIEYLEDASKSIVTKNESPDVPFRYSLNPYRGCIHGCSYCYARNTHEFLGFSAGRDFETKIVVKPDAGTLFHKFLARKAWAPEPICLSGITDCYQPAEREFLLTQQCLNIAHDCGQPIQIITKNALIARDIELLARMARRNTIEVSISITTLDRDLALSMEPRTSPPESRLRTIEQLSGAGVNVRVMVAPVIPGLNDHETPGILDAARKAGAKGAGYILLRLPRTVEPVFIEWLTRTQPLSADKVEGLIRQTRSGQMNSSAWEQRMKGSGPIAEQIKSVFQVFKRKLGYEALPPLTTDLFQRPSPPGSKQLKLF